MKKLLLFLVLALFSVPAFAAEEGSVFDRVMKERTLRCAYTIYPPFIAKDPNTGEIGGLFHDFLEHMGKDLGIKIVWAEEVGSDAIFSGLGTNRYDAVCPGYFVMSPRANGGDFTKPLVFVPSYVYVRKGETRFKTLDDFNKAGVKFGTMDGEFSDIFKRERLPLAEAVSLGGLASAAERLEIVATGKADATAMEAAIGNEYMKHNPGKLEQFGIIPAHIGASAVIVPHDEYALAAYLNAAIDSMTYTGALGTIVKKHDPSGKSFLPPARPYELPQ